MALPEFGMNCPKCGTFNGGFAKECSSCYESFPIRHTVMAGPSGPNNRPAWIRNKLGEIDGEIEKKRMETVYP